MKGITPKQKRIFEFLVEFTQKRGYPPTVREIGEYFGFLWTAARGHLRALERKGLIRLNPMKSRGIEITGTRHAGGFMVPVAGKVRAGRPILAQQDIEAHVLIDPFLFPAKDAFALRITGDSMVDAGIRDGDYVIVKPQESVINGEIGVVLMGDESTVKRIYLKKGEITLKPENRDMEPETYRPHEIRIIGKVIGVLRKL